MALTKLSSLEVFYGSSPRYLCLCEGDLSTLSVEDNVTYLGVSALPNDYAPTTGSLIGSLNSHGVSVRQLADDKYADYRPDIPCWTSKDIPGALFKRIAVFEPENPAINAAEQLTYLFSAIKKSQEESNSPVCVALPLVCTGSGSADELEILDSIFFAAVHWCGMIFPFSEIKLTLYHTKTPVSTLTARFNELSKQYQDIEHLDLPSYSFYSGQASTHIHGITLPDYLTYRQAFGICVYSSNFYSTINRILRSNDKHSDDYKKLRPLLEAIDTGLMNIAPYKSVTYRGESSMTPERLAQHTVGNTVTNLAYTSTSYKITEYYKRNYRFNLTSLTGIVIEQYSLYPSEKEVLFAEGMQYLVKDRQQPGYYLFLCDEKEQRFRK